MSEPPIVASGSGVTVTEHDNHAHVNLRGDPTQARFAAAVLDVLGTSLPVRANTVAVAGGNTLLWLGPDEWLATSEGMAEDELVMALRAALEGLHAGVTGVGGGQTVLALRGAAVCELLSMECPLDLDGSSFVAGACAQTRLAKAPVLIRRLAVDSFEIVIRRSFAGYLTSWLHDALGEFRA